MLWITRLKGNIRQQSDKVPSFIQHRICLQITNFQKKFANLINSYNNNYCLSVFTIILNRAAKTSQKEYTALPDIDKNKFIPWYLSSAEECQLRYSHRVWLLASLRGRYWESPILRQWQVRSPKPGHHFPLDQSKRIQFNLLHRPHKFARATAQLSSQWITASRVRNYCYMSSPFPQCSFSLALYKLNWLMLYYLEFSILA